MHQFARYGSFKGWRILLLLAVLALIPLTVAAADYIGPKNRTTTTTVTQTLRVCYYGGKQYCSCIVDGGECNVTSNPCGDWRGGCSEYPQSKDIITTVPNAISSGNYICGTPGSNGWCKGGARIDFTANEPVSGYVIQNLEGNLGVYCNPGAAATVNCSWTPPQGGNTVTYWAHSSYGDTSVQGTIASAVKFDSGLPTASVGVGTPNGANGWFISPVAATTTGADSASGIASLNVNLDGGAWQANGTTFSNQGTHTVQGLATDNAGNQATSGKVTFSLDSVKPTINTTIPAPNGSNGWFKSGPVSLVVSGTDATSGMSAAQIQIGAGIWQNSATSISDDGSYTVNFRTVDVAGNVNSTSGTVKLDQTAPIGVVGLTGTLGLNGWYVTKPTAEVSGSDATSGVAATQVNLDGGTWSAALSVPDGTHTVAGQVMDNAGNLANTATLSVKVDTVAPTLNPAYRAADGANGWYKTPVILSVSGTDAISGMAGAEIQVDGGAWQANSATLSADGTHTVIFRTRDNAGNASSQSLTFKVDQSGPALSIIPTGTSGLDGWYVSTVNVTAAASDPTSGVASIEYRIDGGVWSPIGPVFLLSEGVHAVDIRSDDNAGNTAAQTYVIKIDSTKPTVAPVPSGTQGKDGWWFTKVVIDPNPQDATSGIMKTEIQINGGVWQPVNTVTLTEDGRYMVGVRVTDKAGNITTDTFTYEVDTTWPACIISQPPIDKMLTGKVDLTGNCTDAGSGIDTIKISVDGGKTWSSLPNKGGTWTFPWDTALYPGPVIIKGVDKATNEETTTHVYKVINALPRVDLQDQWTIWNAGALKIWLGDLPVTRVSISIADWKNRWPAREWTYDQLGDVPSGIKWDRKFADGTLAPVGDYAVRVTVWDSYNRTGDDEGKIIIPPGPPPTAVIGKVTPTATPMAMWTAIPSPTSSLFPLNTSLPTITLLPTKVTEMPAEQLKLHFLPFLALLVFLGLLVGLGLSVSRDPRPAAIHRLAATIYQLAVLREGQ